MKPRNYQCRKCGKINQITTPWGMLFIPHMGWHKWLKCECGAKRHFQRRVFQPEMAIREELKGTYQVIEALESDLDKEKDEYIRDVGTLSSMIDNLRDDIQELKQELVKVEAETVKKIFADIEVITSEYMNNEDYSMGDVIFAIDDLKEKYGVED